MKANDLPRPKYPKWRNDPFCLLAAYSVGLMFLASGIFLYIASAG